MNTKALRQKILDLAIHGKLVPQDPNDEPASVLLERIRAEKERLIKEGKIKKPKKTKAACDKPHYPYELPEGWVWATIGEISWDLVYGTSKKSSSDGDVPVLRMGNINRCGKIDWDNLVYTSDKDDITKYSLQTNDLLFNRTNSSEWVGKTAIYKGEKTAIYAGYIVRLRVIILDADYANFVMNSSYYRDWCNEVKTDAVNQSNINAQKLSQLFIPIPPLNEQKRIVNELSSWLNIIEAINNGKAELRLAIKQAKSKILDLAIHGKFVSQDPNDEPASELLKRINPKAEITCDNPHYGKLPKGWCETTLGNAISIKSGDSIKVRDNRIGKYPIYGGNGVTGNNESYNTDGINIIIGRVGFYCGSIHYVNGKVWVTDNAFVTTIVGNVYTPKFLYYLLVQCDLKQYSNSTAQPVISGKTVYPINVMLPPLSEQHRIVAKIEELFAQLNKIEASL